MGNGKATLLFGGPYSGLRAGRAISDPAVRHSFEELGLRYCDRVQITLTDGGHMIRAMTTRATRDVLIEPKTGRVLHDETRLRDGERADA